MERLGGPLQMNHQYLVRGTFAFLPSEEYPDYESVAKLEMFWLDASDLRELARDDGEVMKLDGNRLVEKLKKPSHPRLHQRVRRRHAEASSEH